MCANKRAISLSLSLSLSIQTRLIRWFIFLFSLSLFAETENTCNCARILCEVSVRFVKRKRFVKLSFRVLFKIRVLLCKGGILKNKFSSLSLSLFSFLYYCLLRGGRSGFRGRDVIAVRFLFKLSRSPVRVDAEERD